MELLNQKISNNFLKSDKGFSLVEILIAMAIFLMIVAGAATLGKDTFFFNSIVQESFNIQEEAKKIIKPMADEIRTASQSSLGSYPILLAGTSTIAFYSNIDDDDYKERIRYFLDGRTLKKGVIKPSSDPLVYNSNNESITELVHNISNDSGTPLFDYFDSSYSGSSNPLLQPVSILDIRLVKITLILESNPQMAPSAETITTQISLRNLKDNF